jgi:hypothetical protein
VILGALRIPGSTTSDAGSEGIEKAAWPTSRFQQLPTPVNNYKMPVYSLELSPSIESTLVISTLPSPHFRMSITMSQPLFLWDPFAIYKGPREKDRLCCGLTKRGTRCQLLVTEDVHNAGVKMLHSLACQPFDLPAFQNKLPDIVGHFLCKR